MDAAATVTKAALAGKEVVADFIDLHHGAGLTRFTGFGVLGISLVGEAAFVATLADATAEVEACTTRASTGGRDMVFTMGKAAAITTLASAIAEVEAQAGPLVAAAGLTGSSDGIVTAVGEAAAITTLAVAITEVEAFTTASSFGGLAAGLAFAALTGLTRGRIVTAVGEAAGVTTLAGAITEVEALATAARSRIARSIATRACTAGTGASAVAELAAVAAVALTVVTEGEARFGVAAFVLAGAFIALLASSAKEVAAHLILEVALGLLNGSALRVLEFAIVTEAAIAGVAKSSAYLCFRHLK